MPSFVRVEQQNALFFNDDRPLDPTASVKTTFFNKGKKTNKTDATRDVGRYDEQNGGKKMALSFT